MTDDLLNQIRAARQEADAIAGANTEPAALRQAVAVLEKHLAELAADAEAEQQKQHDAWEARLAADMEKADAEQQRLRAELEAEAALEERTAKRAGELLQRLNNAMEAAGEQGSHPVANRARESLEAVAAKRRRCWGRDTGDDYDMASFAWTVIGLIEADRLRAKVVNMVLDAIGAETGILPEKSRRADIAAAVQRRFANCSFGTGATRKYEQLMLRYQAREEEREKLDKTITTAAQTITTAAEVMGKLEQSEKRKGRERVTQTEALAIMQEVHNSVYDDDLDAPKWSLTTRTLSNWKRGRGTPAGFTLNCCAADFAKWARKFYEERRARKALRNPYRTGQIDKMAPRE